jgi:hypothetical protein
MINKRFAERLNKELDNIGMPEQTDERIEALSKMLKIHKFQSASYLNGQMIPPKNILEQLAQELEVKTDWLIGD